MKRLSVPLLVSALTVFVGGTVRADPIPWEVSWSPSVASISPDKGKASKITLFGGSDSSSGNLNQPVFTAAAFTLYTSSAPADTPDTFTKKTFDLKVTVTDSTSGQSQDLTFKLEFDGTLSKRGQKLKLSTVPSDPQFTNPLGGHLYRARITSYKPPPFYPRDPFFPGVIMASVTVADLPKQGENPEPSSLILAAMAAPGLGLLYWRRRRQRQRAAVS